MDSDKEMTQPLLDEVIKPQQSPLSKVRALCIDGID